MGLLVPEAAALLSALRVLPNWLLIGVAAAFWIVLIIPSTSGADLNSVRKEYGAWFLIAAVLFSALAIARIADTTIRILGARRAAAKASRVLRLVPATQQIWWHLAQQTDKSLFTQISAEFLVTNTGAKPIKITSADVLNAKGFGVTAHALLSAAHTPEFSLTHPIPPNATVRLHFHAIVRGQLARRGKPLRVSLQFTDSLGETYRISRLLVQTHDKPERPKTLVEKWHELTGRKTQTDVQSISTIPPWTFEMGPAYLNDAAVILSEERRNYAARGRTHGLLGSLNIKVRSEPGGGWSRETDVPELLWDKDPATPVDSPLLEQLLRLHSGLAPSDKDNLERYLLSQLSKKSSFADIAYFIFLALHRMGRTVDAIDTSRAFLAGDTVFGYSNVLSTLSGLISHEHFAFSEELLQSIVSSLAGDEEYDFLLRQKINAARLKRIQQAADASE